MYPSHPSKVFFASVMIFSLLASLFTPYRKKNVQPARAASASPTTVEVRITSGGNDVEQRLSDGFIYKDSSDLELINDPGVAKGDQSVGMRFTNLNIPQGATITRAYLTFHVDETSSEATSLTLRGQAADNAASFTFNAYDVTSRPHTSASVGWSNIPAWTSVGASVQSPDLAPVIQEIVSRRGWAPGNNLVLFVDGSGRRVAVSYEGSASAAPQLHVEYTSGPAAPPTTTTTQLPPTPTQAPTNAPTATPLPATPTNTPTITPLPATPTNVPSPTTPSPSPTNTPVAASAIDVRIASGGDDVEQRLSDGFIYKDSSDLELINDPGVAKGDQSVGMRFTNLNIPQGATITRAYLTFHVDETSSEATSLTLRGQAADNAASFTFNAYDVTSRLHTSASVGWSNIPAWTSVGASVQSPDLAPVIQEIVSRRGWAPGNNLVLFVDGLGRRVAVSYEGSASAAPQLHVEYTSGPAAPPTATATQLPPTPTQAPTNAPTATPLQPTPTNVPTASPTPSGDPQPVGQGSGWNLVFRDEFSGSSIDLSKWHTCFWWADTTCSIETNHELELYNPGDVLVQNGTLQLRAQKRDMTAWNGSTYHYTSGMVMTGGRSGSIPPGFTFTYGYAEARVKVPAGKGLWPAFWMLPVSYNSRPEIDIMEILGDQPDVYHMNYHYIGGDQGTSWTGPDFSAGWHVIGLDWEPNAIVWYVDGIERYRFTNSAYISSEPEYLLLNLAVGGDWPGSPDANTPFPSLFDVDYVRVWQK